ncbi:hypothetical protein [Streptomyces sp. NPDC029554]|uniref:hypothetical protein n=1 Tax=Streptomyces sp. NPDC029554 TaxID=3155126 RepID=UPI0033D4585D
MDVPTEAAEQAGRMRDGIERDGGLRIEGEGWVDLSHIREIHTMTVSLGDLSTVMTATACSVSTASRGPCCCTTLNSSPNSSLDRLSSSSTFGGAATLTSRIDSTRTPSGAARYEASPES